MTDRRNREQDRLDREEDDERRADTERRGEQLRLAGDKQAYESHSLNERTGSYLGRRVRNILRGHLS
jgi:hypothetical protein